MNAKSHIALTLVLLYGLALIRPALPLVEYYLNLEEYKQACINRDKPQMHCNGQCILMQKLNAADKRSADPIPPAPVKVDFLDYPIGFIHTIELLSLNTLAASLHPRARMLFSIEETKDIFHPPADVLC